MLRWATERAAEDAESSSIYKVLKMEVYEGPRSSNALHTGLIQISHERLRVEPFVGELPPERRCGLSLLGTTAWSIECYGWWTHRSRHWISNGSFRTRLQRLQAFERDEEDPHLVLDIPRGSDRATIIKAYRRQVKHSLSFEPAEDCKLCNFMK